MSAGSAFFYLFVKSDTNSKDNSGDRNSNERAPLIDDITSINDNRQVDGNKKEFFDRLSPSAKRIFGISLSVFSGLMYAMFFTPELYVIDNYHGASKDGLGKQFLSLNNNLILHLKSNFNFVYFKDYVFSLYTGIVVASIVYFSIYCVIKKNKPVVNPQVIFPGLISGWVSVTERVQILKLINNLFV